MDIIKNFSDTLNQQQVSLDAIEFHLEEKPYKYRIDSYERKT